MLWTLLATGAGIACLFAISLVAVFIVPRRRRSRTLMRSATIGESQGSASLADAPSSLFGLAPQEAAQFRQTAREQMHREQVQWARDYFSSTSDGALPGRIAGIPRTLRVRS